MSSIPLLDVRNLVKYFPTGGFLKRGDPIRAVDGIDLQVGANEIVGVVGESGSGKSTLARCVLGLEEPTSGVVAISGLDWSKARRSRRFETRRLIQPIFQDSTGSLDPRWTVGRSVREALDAFDIGSREGRSDRVIELLDQVGLSSKFMDRLPHELSGGQRQRVSIAAALAPGPSLLIADEPVTALDVSVQAQVLNQIYRIQQQLDLAVLLISHDLSVVAHICDRVYVMYRGIVVEEGATADVFTDPIHPYTNELLASSPSVDKSTPRTPRSIRVEPIRDPNHDATGCRYYDRCPLREYQCAETAPKLQRLARAQSSFACHVMAARLSDSGSVIELGQGWRRTSSIEDDVGKDSGYVSRM